VRYGTIVNVFWLLHDNTVANQSKLARFNQSSYIALQWGFLNEGPIGLFIIMQSNDKAHVQQTKLLYCT
jgi:hypothetical protein